jgi:HAD superfamily hydrolase (TIGR01490 family)
MTRAGLKARMLELSIAGASRDQVAAWAEAFVSRWMKIQVRPGALAAIARHKAAGDRLVLATASFDFYAAVFARHLGFDDVIATRSVWRDERLCAALDGENCYGADKVAAVKAYLAAHPGARITAYSDHHTDFAFLRMADEGVAVNPNAKLRKLATAHGLAVVDWG